MGVTRKRDLMTPITNKGTTLEDESRIVDAVLQSKLDVKSTPLSRYSGIKTPVIYFSQVTQEKSDYLINLNSFNDIDVNLKIFRKIDDFIIIFKQEMTPDVETDDHGTSVSTSGNAFVLPKTIKPRPGDCIIMVAYGKTNLYRVTNTNPSTMEEDAGFEITISLEKNNFVYDNSPLKTCVVDDWQFEYRHVGTEYRTLFQVSEFAALKKMRDLYHFFGGIFFERFFRKVINTYLLKYDDSFGHQDRPYVEANEDGVPSGPDSMATDAWMGFEFHDREMLTFLSRHGLFNNSKQYVSITPYYPSRTKVYNYSIFGALESRDYKRIKYQYFIPQTLSFATPGFPAVLFGKVDLSYTPSFVDTCLNFFPPQFFERLKIMPNLERKTYDPNFYKSVLDLMIETIAVFVNSSAKDDRHIVERLVLLSSDEFRYDIADIQSEHAFYVFPIIGFVLMKMIESISSDKFSDLNNKPEAS